MYIYIYTYIYIYKLSTTLHTTTVKINSQPGKVVYIYNPSTQEAEAGGLSSRLTWTTEILLQKQNQIFVQILNIYN
jgi:hypothetical protein